MNTYEKAEKRFNDLMKQKEQAKKEIEENINELELKLSELNKEANDLKLPIEKHLKAKEQIKEIEERINDSTLYLQDIKTGLPEHETETGKTFEDLRNELIKEEEDFINKTKETINLLHNDFLKLQESRAKYQDLITRWQIYIYPCKLKKPNISVKNFYILDPRYYKSIYDELYNFFNSSVISKNYFNKDTSIVNGKHWGNQ